MMTRRTRLGIIMPMLLIVAGTAAQAGTSPTLRLQMRGEILAERTDAADSTESVAFKMPYLRLDVRGSLNDTWSYRTKFRLNRTYSDSYADGLPSAVDYAYVDYRVNPQIKLRAGKQYAALGGWESNYSSIDLYGRGSEIWNVSSRLFYRTGIAAHLTSGAHFINVQVLNNSFSDETSGDHHQGFFYGFQYRLSLMDGALTPLLSLHRDTRSEQDNDGLDRDKAGAKTDAALGIRFRQQGLQVEADLLMSDDEGVVSGASGRAVQAVAIRVAQQFEDLTLIGKFARSDVEFNDADERSINATEVALEYAPAHFPSGLKAFVAITHDQDKPETGDTVDYTAVRIGFTGGF